MPAILACDQDDNTVNIFADAAARYSDQWANNRIFVNCSNCLLAAKFVAQHISQFYTSVGHEINIVSRIFLRQQKNNSVMLEPSHWTATR